MEDVSGAAVPRTQPQYVLASQGCNRAFQHGSTPGPLADFASEFGSEAQIWRPTQQPDHVMDSLPRDEAKKRRLLKLHSHALPQRSIKHRVAGGIGKICKHNRVFSSESFRAVK